VEGKQKQPTPFSLQPLQPIQAMSFSGVSLVASISQVVYPEMHFPELGVPALPSDQVVMSAIFHNLAALIKDNDSIGVPDGREPMAANCGREHDILANEPPRPGAEVCKSWPVYT
jgi:hypothetical protein